MTTNIGLLTDCEDQRLDVAVGCQSERPPTKSVQRCPVVMLSHLSADPACRSPRHDSVIMTGRRPSDVYGEAARARWRKGRRPLARSAATIRAALETKSAVASTDDSTLLSNCSAAATDPDNPAAQELQEQASPASAATEHSAVISPSTQETADSTLDDCRDSDGGDRLPVSLSKYSNRKRKLSWQQALKTYGRKSNRTDKLNGRNASLNDVQWNALCSPSSKEMSPAKDEWQQDYDAETDIDDEVACDENTLAVLPIDAKYASISVAAMNVMDFTAQPEPDTDESPTTESKSPIGTTSTGAALSTSSSTAAPTRNVKWRSRAEQTIFERFINTLSLQKPDTSEKSDVVFAANSTKEESGDAVPDSVADAKVEEQSVAETDMMQLETTDKSQLETLIEDEKVVDNSTKSPCNVLAETDIDRCNSTSDDAKINTIDASIGRVIEGDDDTRKGGDGGGAENDASKPQIEVRRTRGIKTMTRYRDDSEILVTLRPVRKRQPTVYIDADFDTSVKSRHRVTSPANTHGSCLLPSDFYSSQTRSSGVARKSWKTVLDTSEILSTRTGPGRPKKTKRQYRRRKRLVPEDEIKWTIHKKLLLGGSTSKKPKSARGSKFPGKRKTLKAPPKSPAVGGSMGSKLRTRSMTRIQEIAAEQKSATDTTAQNADMSLVAAGDALAVKDELLHAEPPTSCAVDSSMPPTDDVTLKLTPSSSQSPETVMTPATPSRDEIKESSSSDSSRITSSTTTPVVEERVDKDDAVETATPTSSQDNVQHREAEPEVPPADSTSADEASVVADQSATKMVGDGLTSTTATNTDETKVDDESVEALMHLVKQIHDAVANEKLRKAKGEFQLRGHSM